ncbi:hypothetical protein RBSWK_01749 [Rhodopirellula baltica SWK14]|uniref:Uncharacterized protein n=1 Tax=Rhodopirellula baltica SWK14 TaxID=993516 RepID=L7CKI5_RHOBT|nr:hypothetical protein RBSWK_01749 [Rhodopirellula baltica SWK14]
MNTLCNLQRNCAFGANVAISLNPIAVVVAVQLTRSSLAEAIRRWNNEQRSPKLSNSRNFSASNGGQIDLIVIV